MKSDREPLILADDGELPLELARTEAANAVYDAMPDLFLVDPRDLEVITGRCAKVSVSPLERLFSPEVRQHMKSFAWKYVCVVILLTLFGYVQSHNLGTSLNAAIYLVCGIYIFWTLLWGLVRLPWSWRTIVLERQGQLLKGEVVRYKRGTKRYGFDEIHYRFATPEGRRLVVKKRIWRRNGSTVQPGQDTPVAVLYVNDRLFRLL